MICIYKITNPIGQIYIGSTINFDSRLNQYKSIDSFDKRLISESIKEYGYQQHIFQIIEECSVDILVQREMFWIKFYRSNKNKYPLGVGMNLCDGQNTNGNVTRKKIKYDRVKLPVVMTELHKAYLEELAYHKGVHVSNFLFNAINKIYPLPKNYKKK